MTKVGHRVQGQSVVCGLLRVSNEGRLGVVGAVTHGGGYSYGAWVPFDSSAAGPCCRGRVIAGERGKADLLIGVGEFPKKLTCQLDA